MLVATKRVLVTNPKHNGAVVSTIHNAFRPRTMLPSSRIPVSSIYHKTGVKIRRGTATTTTTTTATTPPCTTQIPSTCNIQMKLKGLDLAQVAEQHGVRLTQSELVMLRRRLDLNGDGIVTAGELRKVGQNAMEQRYTRELFLSVIEQPRTRMERFVSNRVLAALDYGGTALFAIVGTTMAGEKNMNLIGCCLVGIITACGGGTLNNLFYGTSSLLLEKRPGVFWVRAPSYLILSMVASIVTFYVWPIYCRSAASDDLHEFIGRDNVEKDGRISKKAFVEACRRNPEFAHSVAAGVGMKSPKTATAEQIFAKVDVGRTNTLSQQDMEALAGKQYNASPHMYAMDTVALSAFAVVGVNGAVQRGLHPVVSATCGVSLCFGGLIRDVLLGRDIAIGGQSYAFCTGAGATVYVLCRELRLRGYNIPKLARIVLSFGTTFLLRVIEYVQGESLLQPMHGELIEGPQNVIENPEISWW